MLDACIVEEGGEELEYEGSARMYLRQYLPRQTFISSIEAEISRNLRTPMVRDGVITVCSSDLQMFINKTTQQNIAVRPSLQCCPLSGKMQRTAWEEIQGTESLGITG